MVDHQIVFETSEEIATIILNRPEKGNTFDWTTIKEMEEALYRVEHDEGVRGMILTGTGEKYFCLGADIKLMESIQGKEYAEFLLAGLRLNEKIQRCRKPDRLDQGHDRHPGTENRDGAGLGRSV
jgi:enoyl-CoA hydratase